MFNVGGGEVLVILLIALIVLGPDKLPNAARQAGKYLGDFRRMSSGFQRELRDAMDLNDLTSSLTGTSKPVSRGGPTTKPRVEPAGPSTTAEPETPTSNGTTDATAPAETPGANPATNGTSGSSAGAATASSDGAATANGSGTRSAVVRKRSIEVDGPSASFD